MDISKVKLVDFFKPKKIKAFLRYLASKYLFDDRNLIEISVDDSEEIKDLKLSIEFYKEFSKPEVIYQIAERFNNCKDCILTGACLNCGCDMPEKAMDFAESCPEGRWGPVEFKELKELIDERSTRED